MMMMHLRSLNASQVPNKKLQRNAIGVLDIYGFEIFKVGWFSHLSTRLGIIALCRSTASNSSSSITAMRSCSKSSLTWRWSKSRMTTSARASPGPPSTILTTPLFAIWLRHHLVGSSHSWTMHVCAQEMFGVSFCDYCLELMLFRRRLLMRTCWTSWTTRRPLWGTHTLKAVHRRSS